MLGIIIGITSVVTIVSIGNGLKKDVVDASNEQNNTVTIPVSYTPLDVYKRQVSWSTIP